jgi:hypothetical protein
MRAHSRRGVLSQSGDVDRKVLEREPVGRRGQILVGGERELVQAGNLDHDRCFVGALAVLHGLPLFTKDQVQPAGMLRAARPLRQAWCATSRTRCADRHRVRPPVRPHPTRFASIQSGDVDRLVMEGEAVRLGEKVLVDVQRELVQARDFDDGRRFVGALAVFHGLPLSRRIQPDGRDAAISVFGAQCA